MWPPSLTVLTIRDDLHEEDLIVELLGIGGDGVALAGAGPPIVGAGNPGRGELAATCRHELLGLPSHRGWSHVTGHCTVPGRRYGGGRRAGAETFPVRRGVRDRARRACVGRLRALATRLRASDERLGRAGTSALLHDLCHTLPQG